MQRISTPSEAEFVLRFTAYGTPQTQGSLSRSWSWAQKRVITRDKPALYAWRDEVALAARRRLPRGFKPFDGPVTLGVLFVLVRTPTDTRLKRQFPETHLDLDKALRAERDSLKLRVQQLEADEDRLDWLGETATMAQVVMLACALNERDDVREAIDALRTAGK